MDLSRQPKSSMTDSPKMYGAAGPASFPAMRQRRQIPQPSLSTGKQDLLTMLPYRDPLWLTLSPYNKVQVVHSNTESKKSSLHSVSIKPSTGIGHLVAFFHMAMSMCGSGNPEGTPPLPTAQSTPPTEEAPISSPLRWIVSAFKGRKQEGSPPLIAPAIDAPPAPRDNKADRASVGIGQNPKLPRIRTLPGAQAPRRAPPVPCETSVYASTSKNLAKVHEGVPGTTALHKGDRAGEAHPSDPKKSVTQTAATKTAPRTTHTATKRKRDADVLPAPPVPEAISEPDVEALLSGDDGSIAESSDSNQPIPKRGRNRPSTGLPEGRKNVSQACDRCVIKKLRCTVPLTIVDVHNNEVKICGTCLDARERLVEKQAKKLSHAKKKETSMKATKQPARCDEEYLQECSWILPTNMRGRGATGQKPFTRKEKRALFIDIKRNMTAEASSSASGIDSGQVATHALAADSAPSLRSVRADSLTSGAWQGVLENLVTATGSNPRTPSPEASGPRFLRQQSLVPTPPQATAGSSSAGIAASADPIPRADTNGWQSFGHTPLSNYQFTNQAMSSNRMTALETMGWMDIYPNVGLWQRASAPAHLPHEHSLEDNLQSGPWRTLPSNCGYPSTTGPLESYHPQAAQNAGSNHGAGAMGLFLGDISPNVVQDEWNLWTCRTSDFGIGYAYPSHPDADITPNADRASMANDFPIHRPAAPYGAASSRYQPIKEDATVENNEGRSEENPLPLYRDDERESYSAYYGSSPITDTYYERF